jgi:hypothetical protein
LLVDLETLNANAIRGEEIANPEAVSTNAANQLDLAARTSNGTSLVGTLASSTAGELEGGRS